MRFALCLSLVLWADLAAQADSYDVWKAAQGPQDASRAITSVTNGLVTVNVGDIDSNYPAVSPSARRQASGLCTAMAASLVSYFRLRIDGLGYGPGYTVYGSYDFPMTPTFGPTIFGSSIITTWWLMECS